VSYVTNVILHIGILDDAKTRLQEVNHFFEEGLRPLISVDDPTLPRGWYGGDKMLECKISIGAFNYLYLDGLITHLKTIKWEEPESLQLLVKDGRDDKFRIVDVFGPRE
jgi:hypothetical protein